MKKKSVIEFSVIAGKKKIKGITRVYDSHGEALADCEKLNRDAATVRYKVSRTKINHEE